MNTVLLVQPPDPPMPVVPLDSTYGERVRYVPPWNLQCLRAYLLNKTRHSCAFIDCRLFSDLEANFVETIRQVAGPPVLVVNTSCAGLGQAIGVIEIAKTNFPDARIILCGQFPSEFPDKAAQVPHVDFALAGDPEPILRNVLDSLGISNRLSRLPGLIHPGSRDNSASWLPDLLGLTLPDWQGIFWPAYEASPTTTGGRAKVRLSRGQTGAPIDRALGHVHEPFRAWPLARVAACLQRCAHLGIVEVFVADAPGFWTVDRIKAWCTVLRDERNRQAWAFQMPPLDLDAETATLLYSAGCRRVEILMPSSSPGMLERFGCNTDPGVVDRLVRCFQATGIAPKVCFWLGNPEEQPGEAKRVIAMIGRLGFCPFSLRAFPFNFDSPFYAEQPRDVEHPTIDTWLNWARHPWTEEKPLPVWGGALAQMRTTQAIDAIERAVSKSPTRRLRRMFNTIRSRNWILEMENAALSFLAQRYPPKNR
ncbi:MAG TPA: hypothetical protein VIH35_10155 [Kiritimatiellia bacterium]